MLTPTSAIKFAGLVAMGLALSGALTLGTFGAGRDDAAIDPEIAGPLLAEPGIWRTKTQQVFDPVERTLLRRMYMVWDTAPSRNLDFVWTPDVLRDDQEGKVNGQGRLIWRFKGKPAYDPASIYAEFRGVMKDGRPEGRGSYLDTTGIAYVGEWKNGVMEGQGTLTLANGDEYIGQFRDGKANGAGRYVDFTGEAFEGRFVDGQRDGRGTTTLPNGNTYRSTWAAGKESEDSRSVRISQLVGQRGPAADDVRLGITINRAGVRDGDLRYAATNAGPRLAIRPDNKRLMDMWKGGGEIQLTELEEGSEERGVFSLDRAQLFPLTLVLEVQNRSSAPIQVAGAFLAVESSVSDLQPAIQLSVGQFGECSGQPEYRPMLKLENYGWGPAERANLRFAFTNPTVRARPAALGVSKSVGRIGDKIAVDLEPELRSAGVNVNLLKRSAQAGLVCTSKDRNACLQQLRASGTFGSVAQHITLQDTDIVLGAAGTLDYGWQDSKGGQRTASSPFNARLLLGHVKRETECGEGGGRDPIAARPIDFRLDQSGYRLPLAFQRSVPAGRTSQFTVTVRAAKSSEHNFSMVLQLADGREIASRPINLLYYVPKWFQES
jgi:hypothetical protein